MTQPNITMAGTVSDQDGRTITVHQDHDGIRIDMGDVRIMLTMAGAITLCTVLEAAQAAAIRWRAPDADDDPPGNCSACWHLWRVHDSSGCTGRIYPPHSLGGEPCPCEHTL